MLETQNIIYIVTGIQTMYKQESDPEPEPRRKTSFSTPPPNTTTWQQHYMQQPQHS